ncbi:MAG TPA: hypothetical protein VE130_11450 [Nitrososphaeraceae archaeon]|nr:hypothetical protein [Nitrososphaeraceae archaeon]
MSNKLRIAKGGTPIALCLLMITTFAMTAITLNEVKAEDKSTSITCSGAGPCEKTECIDGDCETTITNSSNITSIERSSDYLGNEEDTRRSLIEERLSLLDR